MKRTWIIEEDVDPETGDTTGGYDREQLHALFADLEGQLFRSGGMLSMATRRVKTGELPGVGVLAESREVVVSYQAFSPMSDEDRPPAERDAEGDGAKAAEPAAEAGE